MRPRFGGDSPDIASGESVWCSVKATQSRLGDGEATVVVRSSTAVYVKKLDLNSFHARFDVVRAIPPYR